MSEAEVSGRAFLGLVRYVKDRAGPSGLTDVIQAGGPSVALVFASRVRVNDWHPYGAYVAFLRALKVKIGTGDRAFFRTLGALAGKRDLGSVFRVYAAIASAERLIQSSARVWPSYYRNAGTMRATRWQPNETVLVIEGFPGMDIAHCQLMEGWMIQAMDTIGYRVSDGHETKCMSRGDPFHEFSCTWRKR